MKDHKWFAAWMTALILTIGSCTAYVDHNNTEYEIARLECQQNEADE